MSDVRRLKKIQEIFAFLKKVTLKYRDESFVMSVEEYFMKHGDLTEKQFETLMNIYERV